MHSNHRIQKESFYKNQYPLAESKRGYGSESTREWTSRGVKAAVDVESAIQNSTRCPAEGGMPS